MMWLQPLNLHKPQSHQSGTFQLGLPLPLQLKVHLSTRYCLKKLRCHLIGPTAHHRYRSCQSLPNKTQQRLSKVSPRSFGWIPIV